MKVKNSQQGFTLIEILVSMAVGGLLLGGLVVAIFQTFGITMGTTTQIAALENVKSVAYSISKDVRMAASANQSANLTNQSGSFVLDWTSWYDSQGQLNDVYYRCRYRLSGGKLTSDNGSYDPGSENVTLPIPDSKFSWSPNRTVARFISSIQFSRQGNVILATITASPDGRAQTAENMTYYMYLQPKENPIK